MTSRERRTARKWRRKFRNIAWRRQLRLGRKIQSLYPGVPLSVAVEAGRSLERHLHGDIERRLLDGALDGATPGLYSYWFRPATAACLRIHTTKGGEQ